MSTFGERFRQFHFISVLLPFKREDETKGKNDAGNQIAAIANTPICARVPVRNLCFATLVNPGFNLLLPGGVIVV